jgi:adenine C2-methylase RlmN of 23S rRNA A2503 and tRNA A37
LKRFFLYDARMSQLKKIEEWLSERGEPGFRAKQVRADWYRADSWDGVTTLSKELRAEIAQEFDWVSYSEARVVTSKKDDTKKALLTLEDGNKIETVYMPNARGSRTVCISSQVGCAMACTFCATGTMGLMRNLTVDEIVDQVRFWRFTTPRASSGMSF